MGLSRQDIDTITACANDYWSRAQQNGAPEQIERAHNPRGGIPKQHYGRERYGKACAENGSNLQPAALTKTSARDRVGAFSRGENSGLRLR